MMKLIIILILVYLIFSEYYRIKSKQYEQQIKYKYKLKSIPTNNSIQYNSYNKMFTNTNPWNISKRINK
jgi:hypothetical protein